MFTSDSTRVAEGSSDMVCVRLDPTTTGTNSLARDLTVSLATELNAKAGNFALLHIM